ncbi:MAG TPA: sigma-70 family RNA polymerase sigma factor [Phycisphaerae bacterium]|nr:sigma-70 family RNA polymerase sigma factor [Phycisphaerae bacterium]
MDRLEELYRRVGPVLLAYLRRHVGRGDAEELLQETFVIAARQPDALVAADSPRAWLFGIARNLARQNLRRRAYRDMASLDGDPAAAAIETDDRLDAMRSAIRGLPIAQREVLEIRLADDLSYAEIAEALAIPIGTVRSRLHHAIAALRTALISSGAPTVAAGARVEDPPRRAGRG